MKTKTDINSLIKAAKEITRKIGNFPSSAELQLREALGICIPPHVSHLVQDWASGPAEEVDTIDGINPDAFLQGPVSDIAELDDIPEGHGIVGLGKNGKVVIRGLVFPNHDVNWFDSYERERFLELRRFYDQLDLDEIFPDGATSFDAGTDWRLLGNTGDRIDDWRKDILINTRTKDKLTRRKTIIVLFKPESRRIISAKVDNIDLMPMVPQPEPESPFEPENPSKPESSSEHNNPGFEI